MALFASPQSIINSRRDQLPAIRRPVAAVMASSPSPIPERRRVIIARSRTLRQSASPARPKAEAMALSGWGS